MQHSDRYHFLGASRAKGGRTLAGSDTDHVAPLRVKVEHVAVVVVSSSSNLFCPERARKLEPEVQVCIRRSIQWSPPPPPPQHKDQIHC